MFIFSWSEVSGFLRIPFLIFSPMWFETRNDLLQSFLVEQVNWWIAPSGANHLLTCSTRNDCQRSFRVSNHIGLKIKRGIRKNPLTSLLISIRMLVLHYRYDASFFHVSDSIGQNGVKFQAHFTPFKRSHELKVPNSLIKKWKSDIIYCIAKLKFC